MFIVNKMQKYAKNETIVDDDDSDTCSCCLGLRSGRSYRNEPTVDRTISVHSEGEFI